MLCKSFTNTLRAFGRRKFEKKVPFTYTLRQSSVIVPRTSMERVVVPQRGITHDESTEEPTFHQPKEPLSLEDVYPSIIYIDDNYCVIDKPPGIRMDGNFPITIEKLVAKWTQRSVKEIKWMHQLDFATSGVLCIGLHREAVAAVVSSFEHRTVRKAYLAVLQGHLQINSWPELSSIDENIANETVDSHEQAKKISEVQQKFVEEQRKGLVSTGGRNAKRKLQELISQGQSTQEGSEVQVVDSGSTWQEQVMRENLQLCLQSFRSLSLQSVLDISPQLQSDYQYLQQFSEEDFLKGPKLRKLLRKLLSKCGISVDLVASNLNDATSSLPSAAAVVQIANAAKQTTPLSDSEVEEVCQSYRNPHRVGGPAIFRIQTPHSLSTNPLAIDTLVGQSVKGNCRSSATEALATMFANREVKSHHLVVNIPVAELDGDFRMEPGHLRNPGKNAVTEVFVLSYGYYQGKPVTKVLMKPISGRRHQLRIHSRCLGHPIVGDFTYNTIQREAIASRSQAYQSYVASLPVVTPTTETSVVIPAHLRQEFDAHVAERMMLHAYCIHIPFPNEGRATVPYKRKILEASRWEEELHRYREEHGITDVPQNEQDRIRDEIHLSFDQLSSLQIRDMRVTCPLIDIATPVDPFPMLPERLSPSGKEDLVLKPVLPTYMQRVYDTDSS